MRSEHNLNQGWLYCPQQLPSDASDTAFTPITLPHTNTLLPYHNFDDAEYQFISTYRKHFTLPEPLDGRRLFLHFGGALLATTVQLNGHSFPEYRGGFTPFAFDITDFVTDGTNALHIHLDSRERTDIPPFGHTVDYMIFGGIYRDVTLRYVAPIYLDNVQLRSHDLLTDAPRVEFMAHVRNMTDQAIRVRLVGDFAGVQTDTTEATVEPFETVMVSLPLALVAADYTLWSPNTPTLYAAHVTLQDTDGIYNDVFQVRTGLREAQFRADGFYLNGTRLQLRGLNRHQNYPYIGAAAPARLQRKDAEIVKYELGCNMVRTSHYPQSPYFLERCDEIGLMVFEEVPGWQHIGDNDWQCLTLDNVREMITRDWNHPSIIIWGVRINESWDNHDFYTETNRLAREIDPTRATGGVRFFLGSEFLEDVYTLNDFSNGIMEPQVTPHLVTEYIGHMFPTKTYDNEERRTEHALRHARVQSQSYSVAGVSGAIGWCAFDYNTHIEFGAGDRICYHGVMDIFRLPKFAAWFYASQQSPKDRIVLKAATNWSLGDVKEGLIEPITVFSNCEVIEAYVGGDLKGTFLPDAATYHVPHPPFTLSNLGAILAHPYGDLKLIGLIDGKPVAEHSIASESLPAQLHLVPDDVTLHADGADMTRLVFTVTDKYANPLPYSLTVVTLTVVGDAELIGENPFPLVGGQGAVYIKSRHQTGVVRVTAQAPRLADAEVSITLL